MFTGLVTDVGRVRATGQDDGVVWFEIESSWPTDELAVGASVCHSGVCLTLVDCGSRVEGGSWWAVEAVQETISRTILGEWIVGTRVNLERSLMVGDELGGHFVAGHVDGVGQVTSIDIEGGSWRIRFEAPSELARYFAEKGSVAINGVSLTISGANRLDGGSPSAVEVVVIPHTLSHTTLGELTVGARVNIEIDLLARYVGRMLGRDTP